MTGQKYYSSRYQIDSFPFQTTNVYRERYNTNYYSNIDEKRKMSNKLTEQLNGVEKRIEGQNEYRYGDNSLNQPK